MDWMGLTEVVLAAVRAAHRAGLPHIARELYSVSPIQNETHYAILVDRVSTVKTLLRLRPPPPKAWDKCKKQMETLFTELAKR